MVSRLNEMGFQMIPNIVIFYVHCRKEKQELLNVGELANMSVKGVNIF